MGGMFYAAIAFNQPLDSWDTSVVTLMDVTDGEHSSIYGMFNEATAFNQPLNSWNTSAVTLMDYMFNAATAFNQPLDSWDTSAVTTMSEMFLETNLSVAKFPTNWRQEILHPP